tara:strand:+ start:4012 stop:5133 length:1122 start_codon:yes stop_codon:yes gene_type:complete
VWVIWPLPSKVEILPVSPSHLPDLVELNEICGFPARSLEGWRWVLFDNPEQGDEPAGYVAMKEGRAEAFLCTQRRAFKSGTTERSMVSAHTFVSRQAKPGLGLKLLRHMLRSHGADAANTLNNNALSAPMYPHVNAFPWRGELGRVFLEKPVRWSALLRSRIYNALKNSPFKMLASGWQHLERGVKALPKAGEFAGFTVIDPADPAMSSLLDAFNEALQAGATLQPNRSSEIWRYRLADPDYHDAMRLLGVIRDGAVVALLAVSLAKDDMFSASALEIEDMVSLDESAVSDADMLDAAVQLAKVSGAARVRRRVITQSLADNVPAGWMLRERDYHSAHMQSRVDDLPDNWAEGPFDSDFFFALRRPEVLRVRR